MLEDHAGNLWVGVDDGLYLFKDGRFRRIPEPKHRAAWNGDWPHRGRRWKYLGGLQRQTATALSAFAISRFVK